MAFIAANWWTWPIAYACVGALLAGVFDAADSVSGYLAFLLLWPLLLLSAIGAFLKDLG